MKLPATVAVLAIVAASCAGGDDGRTERASVRDSAGIRIVRNDAAPVPGTAREVVRIGEMDGPPEYTFHRIAALRAGPNGGVYVLDGGDNVVRVYDSDGNHVRNFGGAGEGPAEFRSASHLLITGDTVTIYDWRLQKLALFDLDGELLETRRVPFTLMSHGFMATLARVPEGFVATFGRACRMPPPEDRRPTWRAVLTDTDMDHPRDFGTWVDRAYLAIYADQACSGRPAVGGRSHRLAAAPDGRVAYGDGDVYEVRVFRVEGAVDDVVQPDDGSGTAPPITGPGMPRPEMIIRRSVPARAVTPEDRRAEEAAWAAGAEFGRGRELSAAGRAALDTAPSWAEWPAFDRLLWDDAGRLWVRRVTPLSEAETTPRQWDVFEADGVLTATWDPRPASTCTTCAARRSGGPSATSSTWTT